MYLRMHTSFTLFFVSGCYALSSKSRPLIKPGLVSCLCFIPMISTMMRSIGSSFLFMPKIEFTAASVKTSASSAWTLVHRDVQETSICKCFLVHLFVYFVSKPKVHFLWSFKYFCNYSRMKVFKHVKIHVL